MFLCRFDQLLIYLLSSHLLLLDSYSSQTSWQLWDQQDRHISPGVSQLILSPIPEPTLHNLDQGLLRYQKLHHSHLKEPWHLGQPCPLAKQ